MNTMREYQQLQYWLMEGGRKSHMTHTMQIWGWCNHRTTPKQAPAYWSMQQRMYRIPYKIQRTHLFQNWHDSSSAMETDRGTYASREGPWSQIHQTYRGLWQQCFSNANCWSSMLEETNTKLECANHACKCYRASLEKMVQQDPTYKSWGGLTGKMRQHLTSAAHCAIKLRSEEPN